MDYIPSGWTAFFRVKSWWTDEIKCIGEIRLENTTKSSTDTTLNESVLSTLAHFDFIERNFGFFKYQQENLHKSNVYSINLSNTGLNPAEDETKLYTKEQVIERLLPSGIPSGTNDFFGNNQEFNFRYNRTYDYFYAGNTLNNEFNFTFGPNIISSFVELSKHCQWENVLGTNRFFNKNMSENITSNYKLQRQLMRSILEQAIRSSVSKYMPIDTTLWKINYTGK